MELLHIHYHGKGRQHKYVLLLYLGKRHDKICGVLTTDINDEEKALILLNKPSLSSMSLDKALSWLKANTPIAYKTGYREIFSHNATIISRHKF